MSKHAFLTRTDSNPISLGRIKLKHGVPKMSRLWTESFSGGEEIRSITKAAICYVMAGSGTLVDDIEYRLSPGKILRFSGGEYSVKADEMGLSLAWIWDLAKWIEQLEAK